MHIVALLPIERCRQLYEDCFSITSLLTPEAERIYYEEALGLMQSLPAAPSEDEGSVEERGMWSFTEGILRMVLGSTASETGSAHELFVRAEADIGRSLKAHPTNVDAWIALSELSWRKQDYADARRALCMAQTYTEHLDKNPTCESNFPDKPELKKTQRRRIHRELGRILKYCGGTTAERAECRLAAIDAAKCAVAMDPADPSSWYVLGHAFLAEFMSNAHTAVDLLGRCVKAFRRALQLLCEHRPEGAGCARQHSSQFFITPHPDIYYNMGVVLHFQGHFNEACCYLRHAYKQDPTHLNSAKNLVDEMIQTSVRARSIVANRGGLSTRSLAKRLPKTGITLDEVSAAKASSNTIPPTPVSILILDVLSASHTVPVSVVGVDRKLRFVLLLLYNVRYDAVCCYDVVACKFPPSVLIDEDQNKVSNKCMFPAVQSDGDVCGNTRGSATPLWEDVMEGLTIVIPDLSTCLWNGKQVNSLQMFETPSLMVHTFSS